MLLRSLCLHACSLIISMAGAQEIPENLVADGIPSITPEFRHDVARYLDFKATAFSDWHPTKNEMLVLRRATDSIQLFQVAAPLSEPVQLTSFFDPVTSGSIDPQEGKFIIYAQDKGGDEFYQLYRFDLEEEKRTRLTDGQSRNTGPVWSHSGKWIAYNSTRRNRQDTDLYLINPRDPASDQLLCELPGGGWHVADWSADDSSILLLEVISINESYLHLCDVKSKSHQLLTPKTGRKTSYGNARFGKSSNEIFYTSDKDSEFLRLICLDRAKKTERVLTDQIHWDIEDFELSPDGKTVAFLANQEGSSVLRVMDWKSGREMPFPKLPLGVITGLKWQKKHGLLAFNLSSASSPTDAYSFDPATSRLTRWTKSEIGLIPPGSLVEPTLERLKSFDGLEISAFVYRPDPKKFPGKRPVLISIHGGPESQARPVFLARFNYLLNELGVALVYPNVRGSAGKGKTFLELDNGLKREDSVKDIGAVLDWIKKEKGLDGERIAVYGGSYGGYMVLACMTHFNDLLKCGVDVVGISNFLTFLRNTQAYRRDLRRAEYGDERDAQVRDFLEKISPVNNVARIKKPLFVIQGKNDPRVPVTESEQMVRALRTQGGKVWYLMAKDEGHGFAKKNNADFQFLAMIHFLRKNLLPPITPQPAAN